MSIKGFAKSRTDQVRECYEQFGPALVAYACSILGDYGSAEDALQQVFLKLLKRNIEVPTPAKPYLFRAVRNTALSLMRGSGRNIPLGDEAEQTGTPCQHWFEVPAELGYWNAKLENVIRQLPVEQSEVLVMKVWGEMTFDEIATVLDISMNTAASRYRYAIAKLRESIYPFEVENEHATK